MAAIIGPGGPSTATKIAMDGPGGPLAVGDQLRCDRPFSQIQSQIDNHKSIIGLAKGSLL